MYTEKEITALAAKWRDQENEIEILNNKILADRRATLNLILKQYGFKLAGIMDPNDGHTLLTYETKDHNWSIKILNDRHNNIQYRVCRGDHMYEETFRVSGSGEDIKIFIDILEKIVVDNYRKRD